MFKRLITLVMSAAVALGGLATPVAAQTPPAAPQVTQAAPPATVERESYVLGRGDMVEVSVLGRPEYIARVQIQADGTIQLPYINSIPAAERSVLKLRDEIRLALVRGQYFENPAVAVTVVSFASRYVTVLGQVNSPGIVPIDRALRISEIVARAGGLSNPAADIITLTRADGASTELSLREIATAGPDKDPVVGDGDKVFVAPPKTFYIYGQVNAPGTFPVDRGMTLQMALARGGGLTALGSEKRIRLTRGGKEIKNPKLSELVQPDDVLVVGERFF